MFIAPERLVRNFNPPIIMRNLPTLLAFAAILVFGCACGKKPTSIQESYSSSKNVKPGEIEKTYDIAGYKAIEAKGAISVIFTQSDDYAPVRVVGPKKLMEIFEIRRKGDDLLLGFTGRTPQTVRQDAHSDPEQAVVTVYIAAPAPEDIDMSASAVFYSERIACRGELSLDASGASFIAIDSLAAAEVEAEASSAAHIFVGEVCQVSGELSVDASTAGEVSLNGIAAGEVTAEASGAGGVLLVGKTANAGFSASSAGNIDAGNLQATKGVARASSGGSIARSFKRDMGSHSSSGGSIY